MSRLNTHIVFCFVLGSELMISGSCSTPEYVGSRDCAKLVKELNVPEFGAQCERCQTAACDADAECKRQFPCKDGKIVVQGCEDDSDCSDLSALCAKHTERPHNVCSNSDAI
jgi:hypothetical protein